MSLNIEFRFFFSFLVIIPMIIFINYCDLMMLQHSKLWMESNRQETLAVLSLTLNHLFGNETQREHT